MSITAVNRSRRLMALTAFAVVLTCVAIAVNVHYARVRAERPVSFSPLVSQKGMPVPPAGATALQGLTRHIAAHPTDRSARYRLAHLRFQSQDYPGALRELASIEKQNPRDPEVHLRKAVVLKYAGKPEAAEQSSRRALSLEPSYGLAEVLLGEILLDQNRSKDALKTFESRLKRDPESAGALLGKGRALEQLYRAQKPISEAEMLAPVEKAFELSPSDAKVATTLARMRLAYVRTEKGLDGAEHCALRATKLDPADAQPFIILAQIYLARPPTPANLEKVGYYAAQAGVLDLRDPRPPYLVGRVALSQNDAPRAVKALELSLQLGPLPETVTQLAVAHRRAGNREQAEHYSRIYRDYARRLARRDALLADRGREPQEVRHYHDLARLYLDAGQPDSASAWLERARTVRRRDETRDLLLARAQELRKQGNDAPLLSVP